MKEFSHTSFAFRKIIFGGAIATLATSSFLANISPAIAESNLENSPKQVIDEVWQIVNNEFVDETFNQTDWQVVREELLSQTYTSQSQAYSAIRSALRQLGDAYTRFLPPKDFEQLTTQTSGELSGVGVTLEINRQTSMLTVVNLLDNSPASKANLQPGDQVLAIDDQPTSLMSVEQASELIKGEVDTQVTLQISRKGRTFKVTLNRAKIELPTVKYHLRQEGSMEVGYISLYEFNSHAAEQMKEAIKELTAQGVKGFVLDLRNNPGGLLLASVDIARMWVETGEIVHTVDRLGGDREFTANRTAMTDLPLVVLVNGYSASASEILAGALKDNQRATIVGTTTYGKGTVQAVHSLSDGSGLAVTISQYFPPSGIDINRKGITPDIPLELTTQQKLLLEAQPELMGTQNDPQYARAVSILGQTVLNGNSPNFLGNR